MLPLAHAAARLGITPDALRMRIRRGKAKGFKRDGRLFVELDEHPNEAVRAAPPQSEQAGAERTGSEQPAGAAASARARTEAPGPGQVAAEPDVAQRAWPVVVEFQKVELDRLLRENRRLNQRLDQLMEEMRHLREMQQREQVLRQQEQGLRQQLQTTLDRLAERLALPGVGRRRGVPPVAPGVSEVPGEDAAPASGSAPHAGTPAPVAPEAATPEGPGGAGLGPTRTGAPSQPSAAPPQGRPIRDEPERETPESSYAYDPGGPAAGSERDSAGLAAILRDVGEPVRRRASPAGSAGAHDAPGSPEPAGRPRPPPQAPARPEPSSDEERARLLELLGRMGPTAQERRTAARIMKRLLQGRRAPPRREAPD